jgi:hypothetical protein
MVLSADRDYLTGNNSDECEEEVEDSGSELERGFAELPNEYEADDSEDDEMDKSEVDSEDRVGADSEGYSDSTFEGFSD